MEVKIIYNGEMGFAQSLSNVYEYLIPAKGITFENFMKHKHKGKSNAEFFYDRLTNMDFSFYTDEDDRAFLFDYKEKEGYVLKPYNKVKDAIFNGELYCPVPCSFYIDSENVSEGIILQSSNLLQINEDANSNYDNDNDEIIFDKIRENAARKRKKIEIKEGTTREEIKPLVWVWCKSLCPEGKFIPNSIFNLTPFINSISTTENENGGNFTIKLLSIEGQFSDKGELKSIWSPMSGSYASVENNFLFRKIRNKLTREDDYDSDNSKISREDAYNPDFGKGNVRSGSIKVEKLILNNNDEDKKENKVKAKVLNLFENLLSPNDVVFISYINSAEDVIYTEDLFTDNKKIHQLQWDMIGLVNSVSSSSETEGASSEESISGMDCMKLLLDDGTYFFMNSSGSDTPSSLFENIQIEQQGDQGNIGMIDENNRKSSNRTPLGLISSLYIPTQRNIGFVMNLLLSKLCNVEICPTQLFEHYGESKTYYNIPILQNTDKK